MVLQGVSTVPSTDDIEFTFIRCLFLCNLFSIAETVFKVVNEEHDKLEAKKKAKHQNSITGKKYMNLECSRSQDFVLLLKSYRKVTFVCESF